MHPLQKLMLCNRHRGALRAEKQAGADEATIYLYDMIVSDEVTAEWFGGVAPQSFIKTLAGIDAPVIHLRINSPGGDVFAGRVIEQAIKETDAKVIAHVDGFAASAASYVALAADEVVISEGGFFMIHKAWTMAYGNSDDMLASAALLEKIDSSLIKTYVNATGQDEETIRDWMANETWFTAEEAVGAGFADRIAEAKVKASARWDLSAYTHAPAHAEEEAPLIAPDDPSHMQDATVQQELMNRLRFSLAI